MQIIYSGFDTISFAVKGALNIKAFENLDLHKEKAVKAQEDIPISFDQSRLRGLLAPMGMKGGYAYVIKLRGDLGHVISLKRNLNRSEWNAHVKIRALALATYGWEAAIARVFSDLTRIGFYETGISLNRVDYAMDFLNTGIALNPSHFVTHSRVKKAAHGGKITGHSRGQDWESVTLGKMPNRQIIVYDKRREAIEKRKPVWFEIWQIDPKNITQSVHRVEVRLGKSALTQSEIRTLDDLKARVNAVMTQAVHAIRYVIPSPNDQNISRWSNHPLWDHVQLHVKNHVLKPTHAIDVSRVKYVIKTQKAQEYLKQIMGTMAGLSVFEDMSPETMKPQMMKLIDNALTEVEAHPNHSYWKSRARTEDKYAFLREN